ncbi:DUF6959 family protein [Micromonospora taraxaci]|uniref:DUF6959 family protein n=1 Tax=Micromonospora taraxaci TaxID=1316803 RepID=UPI003F4C8541
MSAVERPELLAREGNVAVVQLPGRRFPGVLIQGDTLAAMRQTIEGSSTTSELPREILEVRNQIDDLLSYYESVLEARGIRLPY